MGEVCSSDRSDKIWSAEGHEKETQAKQEYQPCSEDVHLWKKTPSSEADPVLLQEVQAWPL